MNATTTATENPTTTEETTALPKFADFPDPRPAYRKPILKSKISVDAILQRTNPAQRPANSLAYLDVGDCFASLEAEENELREKERELIKLNAETHERIRVVRETEILLDAREKLLDDRESVLAQRLAGTGADNALAAMEHSLADSRRALAQANQSSAAKEEIIAALREEIGALKAAQTAPPGNASGAGENPGDEPYAGISHKSLAEQVAFLREREAFIEQSENVLFDKAQHLQEWETRLQQCEHDHASEHRVSA
jgi:DNA repair exonuclease SbcCD ATPase subunit